MIRVITMRSGEQPQNDADGNALGILKKWAEDYVNDETKPMLGLYLIRKRETPKNHPAYTIYNLGDDILHIEVEFPIVEGKQIGKASVDLKEIIRQEMRKFEAVTLEEGFNKNKP